MVSFGDIALLLGLCLCPVPCALFPSGVSVHEPVHEPAPATAHEASKPLYSDYRLGSTVTLAYILPRAPKADMLSVQRR